MHAKVEIKVSFLFNNFFCYFALFLVVYLTNLTIAHYISCFKRYQYLDFFFVSNINNNKYIINRQKINNNNVSNKIRGRQACCQNTNAS